MGDYIKVAKTSRGEISIARSVFEKIATNATNEIIGASVAESYKTKNKTINKVLASWFKPVRVTFKRNGEVAVDIAINVKNGANAAEVSLMIQEKVTSSLTAYTENVPFKINIEIKQID